MDIMLSTRFNNPNLPIVIRPGFTDSFDRPAGSLTATDDGKVWDTWGFTPWTLTGDGTVTGADGAATTTVDSLSSDGILTAVVATVGTLNRAGLVLRMIDRSNYLYVVPSTSGYLTLYGRIDNATAFSHRFDTNTLSAGDTLSVELSGPTVTVSLNGTAIGSRTVPELTDATHHGLFTASGADTTWDSITFTAA